MSGGGGGGGSIVPESVIEALGRTSNNIDEVGIFFEEFLSLCYNDVLSQMEPLQRAQSLLLLAKATTTLFTLRLRCHGINPDEHAVKSELERLSLYQEKVQRCVDLSKAPLRPSVSINAQAATRFIEHSLPDLSSEQRQSMREISRNQDTASNYLERSKRRKYEEGEKKSVQTAAKEFLEKAARELLGNSEGSLKGPLTLDDSDSEIDALFGDEDSENLDDNGQNAH